MRTAHTLTEADKALAHDIAERQHRSSGSRGTRGAGASLALRLKGAKGEIAVARMLGLPPQVRDTGGPDLTPDIVTPDGTHIEVKNGLPMEARTKLRPSALYIVVTDHGHKDTFQLIATAYGHEIASANVTPPAWMCPRPGTRHLNYLIRPTEY